MKKNKRKSVPALLLALVLTVGLSGGGAMAYTTPDFTDVSPDNWAYESVMEMADAGVIKGTSATTFSPEMKLSAAMFLTLVGRAAYDTDVQATAEDSWFSAYVRAAQAKGLLTGTGITTENVEGEITRYDMAVILAHVAAEIIKAPAKEADTSAIKDYGDIPAKYMDAVVQVYAQGLINGDGAGNFNGGSTMRRDEAATVLSRLITLRDAVSATPAEPEQPEETIPPRTGEMKDLKFSGRIWVCSGPDTDRSVSGVNVRFCTLDGRVLGTTVSENGEYVMECSIDMADYSPTDNIYLLQATYVAPDGSKYSSISNSELTVRSQAFSLYTAYSVGQNITLYDDPIIVDLDF